VINGIPLEDFVEDILIQIWFMPMSWSIFCTEKMHLTLVQPDGDGDRNMILGQVFFVTPAIVWRY